MPKFLKLSLLAIIVIWLNPSACYAQVFVSDENTAKFNSPYSRIGLGDFADQNFVSASSMGGLGAAWNDAFQVNLINPASLASLKSASFEVAGFAKYGQIDNNGIGINTYAGNFSYMSLGFPMLNELNNQLDNKDPIVDWRMNFALLPYSNVGYNVQSGSFIAQDSITTTFTGKGGTYKILWTNAVKYKDFSLGVSVAYFFGNLINEREVFFNDIENIYFNNLLDEISLSGFIWTFGGQYNYKIDDKQKINFGAYLNSNSNLTTSSSQFYRRINSSFFIADTLRNVTDLKQEAVLPGSFGIGAMYKNSNKYSVGIDFSASQWSNYENEAKPDNLENTWRVGLGAEFIPDIASYNKYMDKVRYRIGLSYEKDPRSDENGEQLSVLSLRAGMGMPIVLPRGQSSFFHWSLEAGQFGNSDTLNETYIKLNLGFTLNDNYWFFKRKFN